MENAVMSQRKSPPAKRRASAREDDGKIAGMVVNVPPDYFDVLAQGRVHGGVIDGTDLLRVLREGRPENGAFVGRVVAVEPKMAGGLVFQKIIGQAGIAVHRLLDFVVPEVVASAGVATIRYANGRASLVKRHQ